MQTISDIMCYAVNSEMSFNSVPHGCASSNLTLESSEFEYSSVLQLLLIKTCVSTEIIFL